MKTEIRSILATLVALATLAGPLFQTSPALAQDRRIQIQFVKWITELPQMGGEVQGDVFGTFAGEVLGIKSIANGKVLELEALYEIIAGDQSFTAHVKGKQNNRTRTAVLNGEVISGWLEGARVHVEYNVVTCPDHGECFAGTIYIRPSR